MKDYLTQIRAWFLELTGNMDATDEEAILTALLLIVVTGLIGGAVAKRLRQPLILGYILAGVVVGYLFKTGLGEVANTAVNSLANVGVALLLFSMGLEFSKKDIRPIFRVAVFGALAQVLFTFLAGAGLAWLLSRDPAINFSGDTKIPLFGSNASMFLFGVCFVSTSTAVVLKTLSSKGFENSLSGRVMIGVSIVQDLTVMPLMLLISRLGALTSSGGGFSSWLPLILSTTFMVLMLTVGARYLPKLTERAARLDSKELFLLSITGIALVSGAISVMMHVSFSFGAFLAGIVLSDSAYGKKALSELSPVRDFFAMLFFVSIGMMLDVRYLGAHWGLVAVLVVLTGFVRTSFLAAVTWIFKYRNVIPVAMLFGMFPTSEIAFVVIGTGFRDSFITSELYSLILSVVVCSMIAGPLVNNLTTPVYSLLRRTLWRNIRSNDIVLPQPDLEDHMVLVGGGRISRVIAHVLIRLKLKYVIVEPSYDLYREAQAEGLNVIYGDPMSDIILAAARIGAAKVLVPMIPKLEECVAVIELARKFNPDIRTVMCATSPETEKRLSGECVDEIILSHFEVSLELTRRILVLNDISEARIQNYLDSVRASRYKPMLEGSPAFALAEKIRAFNGLIALQWTQIQADSPLVGRSIMESDVRARTGMSIVGVIHKGRVDANPRPDTVLHAGDLIAAIGNEEQAAAFARLTHSPMAGSPESATTMAIPI
jgi:CPA2 family monovalent cation:H+ antiporter-2